MGTSEYLQHAVFKLISDSYINNLSLNEAALHITYYNPTSQQWTRSPNRMSCLQERVSHRSLCPIPVSPTFIDSRPAGRTRAPVADFQNLPEYVFPTDTRSSRRLWLGRLGGGGMMIDDQRVLLPELTGCSSESGDLESQITTLTRNRRLLLQ